MVTGVSVSLTRKTIFTPRKNEGEPGIASKGCNKKVWKPVLQDTFIRIIGTNVQVRKCIRDGDSENGVYTP